MMKSRCAMKNGRRSGGSPSMARRVMQRCTSMPHAPSDDRRDEDHESNSDGHQLAHSNTLESERSRPC